MRDVAKKGDRALVLNAVNRRYVGMVVNVLTDPELHFTKDSNGRRVWVNEVDVPSDDLWSPHCWARTDWLLPLRDPDAKSSEESANAQAKTPRFPGIEGSKRRRRVLVPPGNA